jgi:hypothetical protein
MERAQRSLGLLWVIRGHRSERAVIHRFERRHDVGYVPSADIGSH